MTLIRNMMIDIAHASHHLEFLLVFADETTTQEWKEQTKQNTLGETQTETIQLLNDTRLNERQRKGLKGKYELMLKAASDQAKKIKCERDQSSEKKLSDAPPTKRRRLDEEERLKTKQTTGPTDYKPLEKLIDKITLTLSQIKSNTGRPNLPKDGMRLIHRLKNQHEVIIIQADKGSTIVLLDWKTYVEGHKHLADPETYTRLEHDITDKIKQTIETKLDNLYKSDSHPSICRQPSIHLQTAIHPSADSHPSICRQPSIHLQTARQPSIPSAQTASHPSTICRQPASQPSIHLQTASQPAIHPSAQTASQPSIHLQTASQPSICRQTAIWQTTIHLQTATLKLCIHTLRWFTREWKAIRKKAAIDKMRLIKMWEDPTRQQGKCIKVKTDRVKTFCAVASTVAREELLNELVKEEEVMTFKKEALEAKQEKATQAFLRKLENLSISGRTAIFNKALNHLPTASRTFLRGTSPCLVECKQLDPNLTARLESLVEDAARLTSGMSSFDPGILPNTMYL
eukprot:Em0007g319a